MKLVKMDLSSPSLLTYSYKSNEIPPLVGEVAIFIFNVYICVPWLPINVNPMAPWLYRPPAAGSSRGVVPDAPSAKSA